MRQILDDIIAAQGSPPTTLAELIAVIEDGIIGAPSITEAFKAYAPEYFSDGIGRKTVH